MNKLYEKVMNGDNVSEKIMSKLCDWIDSNINDGFLTEDDAKVEMYEKMKDDDYILIKRHRERERW